MATTPTLLRDTSGLAVIVQEGESCNVVTTFLDLAGAAIAKAAIITLTVTLYDYLTSTVINSRNAQTVLDANNGAVASNGTLTLRLGPLDNVIVGTPASGAKEIHCCIFKWTFNDGVATRTGESEPLGITVQNLPTIT